MGLALAALPGAALLSTANPLRAEEAPAKPNSKVAGVQIGLNVPYSFANPTMSGDEVLQNCVQLGLSAVELRAQPVEAFLGLPANLVSTKAAITGGAGPVATSTVDQLREWRRSVKMDRVKEFRKKFETGGVMIEILKVDGIFKMTDDVLDYIFQMAKTLGARAISTEISANDDDLKRLGQFADKHNLMVGYHGHATTKADHWEKAFTYAKHNGANLDIGHYIAGNNGSPVEFLQKHHARVTHVHIKDRKANNGPNVPFGEGDTPIKEVLRLIRDNKWKMQATIEFEYKVPATSDRMTEIARAIKYCRDALA